MAFIVWAWGFSYRNLDIASYSRVEATHGAGGLAVMVQPRSTRLGAFHSEGPIKIKYGKHGEWIYDGVMPGDTARIFPRLATYSDAFDGSWSIFLPHWVIMLAVSIAWLVVLVFWRRHRARLRKLHSPG
ncbi:hypothetical protein [Luteolibacter soli]